MSDLGVGRKVKNDPKTSDVICECSLVYFLGEIVETVSYIQKFFPEANDPLEFPEETTEDDDESSSSYQSAKDNLNSKSEVVTKSELLDAVDSANTPETLNSPQQTNKKSDETIAVASPKNDVTLKLKDAYKSNKTVSTPNPVVVEGLTLQKIEIFCCCFRQSNVFYLSNVRPFLSHIFRRRFFVAHRHLKILSLLNFCSHFNFSIVCSTCKSESHHSKVEKF